ncbi:SDR family oxidoreductase [Streptomyces atratus]|uniref:SDR family oxidoreductase n=1 Tax=Streptomyces atratus TaxID=1893 RepID=UPI0021A8B2D4|nr:SDR family NAD(P)-dependent oxidoreductase [Streptomyces atratus]MCT2546777.1 SDR family NAD(P)-dependent oxidoreductase [Streptomyces atratus]
MLAIMPDGLTAHKTLRPSPQPGELAPSELPGLRSPAKATRLALRVTVPFPHRVGTISPLDDLRTDEWDHMVDVNIKGVLNGIGTALPVFRAQGSGHFVTTASTATSRVVPAMAVYAGTKAAVRAICEGLRQEAGPTLRVTTVSPGLIATDFAEASSNDRVRGDITRMRDEVAIEPAAVARAVAYAIEQPAEVDVNEIVIRPTAQS